MFGSREERLDYENWQLQQEINRMPDPSVNPCEGIEQAYDRQRAEIVRLTEENAALVAGIEAARGLGWMHFEVKRSVGNSEGYRAKLDAVDDMIPILVRHRDGANE